MLQNLYIWIYIYIETQKWYSCIVTYTSYIFNRMQEKYYLSAFFMSFNIIDIVWIWKPLIEYIKYWFLGIFNTLFFSTAFYFYYLIFYYKSYLNRFASVIAFFFVDFCACPTIIVPYPAKGLFSLLRSMR